MTHRTDNLTVTDDHERSRYSLTADDSTLLATMDYRDNGQTVTVLRVFTIPAHRGNGYAAHLVEQVVERIEGRGDRNMDSICWFASQWFDEHPEHQRLLR